MGQGFETGSDNEKIDELQKQMDDINDSQINAVGGNENVSIDSSRGARNQAGGDSGGVRSNQPIIHTITDVDEGGVSTGVFDKINIISSMAIIDHTSSPITLRFIQGTVKDGARIKITPKIGKTINVESGGNILTSSTITITDTDYYELVKYSEAETGVTGGAFKIFLTGAGGAGVSFPIRPPIDNRGSVSTNQAFVLTNTTGHVLKFTAAGDFDVTFSAFPLVDIQQEWEVEIKQDATGGRIVSFPQVLNPPVLPTTPNSTTIVVFRTNDAGATIRVGNTVTTAPVDLSQWATFPAVSDINFATFDGINIDRLLFDQAVGEALISTDVGITSDASGNFLTNAVGEYQWLVDAIVKMKLNASQLTMSANIDMSNKSLFDAIEIDFNTSNLFNPVSLTIIGFDSSSSGLRYNSGDTTTNHQFEIGGEPMVFISRLAANRGAITAEQLLAEELVDLATFDNTSPANGNIWLNLAGLFQFRQNGVTVGLGGAGSQTPWLSDIDADGFDLQDLSNIEFRVSTGIPGGAIPSIYVDSVNRLNLNNGGNGIKFLTNSVQSFIITTASFSHTATVGGLASANFQLDTTGATGSFYLHSFQHQDSLGDLRSYTGIQSFAEDITSTSRDGKLEFSLASNSNAAVASNSLPVALALISTNGVITADFNGNRLTSVLGIISDAVNPADTGFIRMGNAETIVWEANPAGVDVTLQVNSSNQFEFSGSLIPNGTRTLGLSGTKWNTLFVDFIVADNTVLFNADVIIGNAPGDQLSVAADIVTDLDFNFGFTVDFNQGQSGVGAAGAASNLPSSPDVYLIVKQNGTEFVIPAFAKS